MRTVKQMLFACGLALVLLSAAGAQARAELYAVVTINNPTDTTIYYQFKWGENTDWDDYVLPPRTHRCHYTYLDRYNRAPRPYIRFDNGMGDVEEYALEFYAADSVNFYSGKRYDFAWVGPYLVLYSR